MGLNNRMSVVEITNPTNPTIIGSISHTGSTWADIKVYEDVAYVCNESGGGIDVIDLAQVDNGTITLVQRMTTGGLSSVHNIAIDEISGYLYLCGGNINSGRLVAYDLSDPRNPSVAGQMSNGPYLHDAQIVTFTTGPNLGRQICFGAAGSGGLYVIDVTNKSNMYTLSQSTYPGLSYCHQCWLHNVRQTLYVNDETDGIALTRVFDVSNLNNPVLTNTFGWGANSIDHNLYVKDDIIYEANYTSGLRILDTTKDPNDPELIGYFDTYPSNDGQSYNGLWSCFPFFDSGTVIGSDIQNGLFIWDLDITKPVLIIDYPDGQPDQLDPNGGTRVPINVTAGTSTPDEDGGLLHWNSGTGWQQSQLSSATTSDFEAVFPAFDCLASVDWYISITSIDGDVVLSPEGAPSNTWNGTAISGSEISFEDNFQSNLGWTVDSGADEGNWTRVVPSEGGVRCDAGTDADGSGFCYVTGNGGSEDVDGGTTTLYSPVIDASDAPVLSYSRWYNNGAGCNGADANNDYFYVDISSDGGASWTNLETVGPIDDSNGGWINVEFDLSNVTGFEPSANFMVRFVCGDLGAGSIVEAGVDAVAISRSYCDEVACEGDINNDGVVSVTDLLLIIADWGSNNPETDIDGDGIVAVGDLLIAIGNWGSCEG
jgi:choice-of-anchor B domain-containing protein